MNLHWFMIFDMNIVHDILWSSMAQIYISAIIQKNVKVNSTNSYLILAMFLMCFFSPFSSFNDEKIKLQLLQQANHNS